jgi:hypothetical protein
MKLLKILGLWSCFCAAVACAGSIDDFSRSVVFLSDNKPVTEEMNGVRYEVWLKDPSKNMFVTKKIRITGTGFIVASSNVSYLVTAKHVALDMSEESEIVMGGENKEPLHFKMSSITGQPNVRWFHHAVADFSIHPLPTITPEGLAALNRRAVEMAVLESETNLPSRDIYVTALGFPLGLGAQGQFIPLSRESKVASGMLADDKGQFFLLQDPSVSGYSGGPLIQSGDSRFMNTSSGPAVVTGGARCWGFVSATYGDETGGKMSRITPAFYAVELIREAQSKLRILQLYQEKK